MTTKRCYESHPAILIGGHSVYGGACSRPVVLDADIYVGLDAGFRPSAKSYPWVTGESFLYYIQDMTAPSDVDTFKALIKWLATNIKAGKKVHIGCIGGHGRTGTVLAALVAHMDNHADPIAYVRKNYCPKAVESQEQVDFLKLHYGAADATPAKQSLYAQETKDTYISRSKPRLMPDMPTYPTYRLEKPKTAQKISTGVDTGMCIWGSSITLTN